MLLIALKSSRPFSSHMTMLMRFRVDRNHFESGTFQTISEVLLLNAVTKTRIRRC